LSTAHALRTARAIATKDIQVALRDRLPTILGLVVPINFLLLFILFALSGGQAPVVVVMSDHGPLAQKLLAALQGSHSFQIRQAGAGTADQLLHEGKIVAVITIPATFDADLAAGRRVELPVAVNNLSVDFTNDIRRAVPLSITSFYADAFPDQVVVRAQEIDVQSHDTGYVPYLAVSIVVVGILISGLLQGSMGAAREFEAGTMKELMLAPAPRWAIALGKLLAALALNLAASLIVLAIVVLLLRVVPDHPVELLGFGIVLLLACSAIGALAGTLLKRRQAAVPFAMATSLPLFFISGPFGPPEWLGAASAFLAALSPLTVGIALFQHAFHGYSTYPAGLSVEVAVLVGFALAAVALNALALNRMEVR
jgi:ABC-type multidrug transport system permease subunit